MPFNSNRAYVEVRKALANGSIQRPSQCDHCAADTKRIRAHHTHGYEPEHHLAIQWLCDSCHAKEHAHNPEAPHRVETGRKPPLKLHLRIWNKRLARYIKNQAKTNRRTVTTEIAVLLEEGVRQLMKENDNGK